MRTVYWLVRKELLQFFADRQGAVMTILLPVVLSVLLGAIFSPRARAARLELLLVDEDGGAPVRALVEALRAEPTLAIRETNAAQAADDIGRGKAVMAITIPRGASELLGPAGLFAGRPIEAPLEYDPSRELEANMAAGLITKVVMEQVTRGFTDPEIMGEALRNLRTTVALVPEAVLGNKTSWLAFASAGIKLTDEAKAAAKKDGAPPGPAPSEPGAAAPSPLRPPVTVRRAALTAAGPATNFNVYAHNFAGMLCMFLLFLGQQMAGSLIDDRRRGALDRVRTTMASPWQILLGTALGTAAIAAISAVIVYAVAMAFFGVRVLGSWLGFGLMIAATCIMVGGFALLLASLATTEKQLATLGTAAILVMSFGGGAWWPSFALPRWLQTVAPVLPTSWVTQGLAAATWRGLPATAVAVPALALVGFGILFAVLGMRAFRWR